MRYITRHEPDVSGSSPELNSGWRSPRTIFIIQAAVILLTGIAAYLNSLNGPFHFDDLGISDRTYLWPRAFTSGPRQLVDLTFVANQLLHGENVFGYHLVNLSVHLAAATALYGLIHSILAALSVSFPCPDDSDRTTYRFIGAFIPFSTALVFVCHPVQTQAVSYIVQRYTSMVALFYLCSVMTYIRARLAAVQERPVRLVVLPATLSLAAGVLAFRCKETAYTLPLMLITAELFLFNGRLLRNRLFLGSIAILLLAVPAARVAQHGTGGMEDLLYSIQHSTKEELTYSRSDYLLTQFRVVASYLRLLVLPVNLNLDHDVPLQRSLFTTPVLASLLLHLTLLASATLAWFRSAKLLSGRQWCGGICLRLISFGVIWFYLALAVESSIIPILDVMFEHRLYLPSCGGILALVALCALAAVHRPGLRNAVWGSLVLVCCTLTAATIQRNRVWNSDLLLWEDTARKSPDKPRVLANLTAAYLRENQPDKALPYLLRTLELSPGLTDTLNNLGAILDQLGTFNGRYDNGRRYIIGSRSIDMRQYTPWFANTRNNLGLAYEYSGNPGKARQYFEAAVSLQPSFELAWYNLLQIALRQGDRQLAVKAYAKLQSLNPERVRSIPPPT